MNSTRAFVVGRIRCLVTELPQSGSCAVSLMVRLGSVYEPTSLAGGSHLIEHMVFRGTQRLPDSLSISRSFDSMGAQYNAYTDYNMTSYHVKVQTKYLRQVVHMLADMVANSTFKPTDVESEKKVVVEELRRDRDDPSTLVDELFGQIVFKGNELGGPVGGSETSVMAIKTNELTQFYKDNYRAENIVISVAGNVTPDEVAQMIRTSCLDDSPISRVANNSFDSVIPVQRSPRVMVDRRPDMSQLQIVMGFPTRFNHNHPDRYAAYVARTILAGPMSSRLFIAMRETYNLSYTVSCSVTLFENGGEFSVSTGADPNGVFSGRAIPTTRTNPTVRSDPFFVICQEMFRMARDRASDHEVHTAKEFIKGNMLLEMENNENIAEFYGQQLLLEKHSIVTIDTYIAEIEKVTADDVMRVCRHMFHPEMMNVASVGNITRDRLKPYILRWMHHWRNFLSRQKK